MNLKELKDQIIASELRRLSEEGKTNQEAKEALGVSMATFISLKKKHGVKFKHGVRPPMRGRGVKPTSVWLSSHVIGAIDDLSKLKRTSRSAVISEIVSRSLGLSEFREAAE